MPSSQAIIATQASEERTDVKTLSVVRGRTRDTKKHPSPNPNHRRFKKDSARKEWASYPAIRVRHGVARPAKPEPNERGHSCPPRFIESATFLSGFGSESVPKRTRMSALLPPGILRKNVRASLGSGFAGLATPCLTRIAGVRAHSFLGGVLLETRDWDSTRMLLGVLVRPRTTESVLTSVLSSELEWR